MHQNQPLFLYENSEKWEDKCAYDDQGFEAIEKTDKLTSVY